MKRGAPTCAVRVFLDDYHVRQGSSMSVRTPLTKFIETQLGPSDMIGLMYPLQPLSSIRMTRNHEAVIGGIQQFEGRKYDYRPKNEAEQQLAFYPAETVETIRNQVSLSALKGLITHMGSLKEARKALILVSEGYSDILPPQLRDAGVGDSRLRQPEHATIPGWRERSKRGRARSSSRPATWTSVCARCTTPPTSTTWRFTRSIRAACRRPSSTSASRRSASQTDRQYLNSTMDTLRLLSEQTDGRAIVNRNDLDVGMKQIVRDSSAYYLLGYNSSQTPSDGKFHEIKVRVKRAGVQVRARKGYWALTTDDVKAASKPREETPKAFTNALATISQQASAHSLIRTWVGTSRGENGKTKVTFTWEPAPRAAADRDPARAEAPARVMLTAVGPDGSPYFRGRVSDRVTFDVNPGKMQLRMSVEGAASQVLDSDAREVVVPDLTAPKPTLGTPEVYRARLARDYQQLKANADAHSDCRAGVQPNRSPPGPCARLRRGNRGARAVRAPAEPGRQADERAAGCGLALCPACDRLKCRLPASRPASTSSKCGPPLTATPAAPRSSSRSGSRTKSRCARFLRPSQSSRW